MNEVLISKIISQERKDEPRGVLSNVFKVEGVKRETPREIQKQSKINPILLALNPFGQVDTFFRTSFSFK